MPEHAQSNGLAESAVKTVKGIMKKAKASGNAPWMGLLAHRNTPSQDMDTSPAQRLFGRRTKTTFSAMEELLRPVNNHSSTVVQLAHRKSRQADMYDHSAKHLTSLQPQQAVWIVPERRGVPWTKGEVLQECGYRSYWVRTEEGQTLRRNCRHLRPASNSNTAEDEIAGLVEARSTSQEEEKERDKSEEKEEEETQTDTPIQVTRSGRVVRPDVQKSSDISVYNTINREEVRGI